MKITLDTDDVKEAITGFLSSSGIITNGAELEWDIQKPRTGDEEIRVEVTINRKEGASTAVFNPDEPEIDEKEPAKAKGLFSDIEQ